MSFTLQQSHSLQRNIIGKSPQSLKVRASVVESRIGGSNHSVLATFNFLVKEWLEIRIVVLNRKDQAIEVCPALTKRTRQEFNRDQLRTESEKSTVRRWEAPNVTVQLRLDNQFNEPELRYPPQAR